ncbi:hypothetical protein Mlute_00687 [Meiothermus luteus]|jgi:hypothetical protein|uniref:Uncharacterized protein n=1 Tax=Meiothermus luteus TaxID=2026184 RepID=A0A399F122_9DEIN|nr:hypothetical protein [Meiothermus luteus]RIH88271.1 hypothetical protein Mlute_00687 [Meiothermus luteus]
MVLRLLLALVLLGWAWGQGVGSGRHTDSLHGFSVLVPEGYQVKLLPYGLLIGDLEGFVLVRGGPLKDPRGAVASLLQEARWFSGGKAQYHYKEVPGGILVLARGLAYPFHLADNLTGLPPGAFQDGFIGSLSYEAAHLLLPGSRSLLLVSVYLPEGASPALRKGVLSVLRSLEFLPQSSRVAYETQVVPDPLLQMEAFYAPVPRGFTFQGGLVPMNSTMRSLAFSLRGAGASLRMDQLYAESSALQSGFGGSAVSRLIWNGQATQFQGFLCPSSAAEVAELLTALWAQERGASWQVRKIEAAKAPTNRVYRRIQEIKAQEEAAASAGLPMAPQRYRPNFTLQAESGGQVREARVSGQVTSFSRADYIAQDASCFTQLGVVLSEGSAAALVQAKPIFQGFLVGLRVNPAWPWQEAQRAQRQSTTTTRMVLGWLREQQEFNTWMSRSWSNLLSDQTYVRDPSTGEVFRAYKASFDTGTFWRDPVFGGMVGAVERGGSLEGLLRQGGWRQLEESLSGLPGTWRR